jgi:phosphopantothenoylcysteine decarboxylase/phosphopantothenate--cysteine ligase
MNARILLIVGGGIAAYKACELVRLIRKGGGEVRCVLTRAGAQFVTPMTLAALSEQPVHTSLWDLKDEVEMGHIQLSREADLILVAPATADLIAKMAAGIADDLATTLLLATDKPVFAAPAMNVRMWEHEATRRNVARLRADGVQLLDPDEGEMACGEFGPGRLPEPAAILEWVARTRSALAPLSGRHVIVTAGPTHEPIDPVRVIANRSSGKQGFAIAGALARLGARVSLVAGPVAIATPAGVDRIDVETAAEMDAQVRAALPADSAVLVAAVADWRVAAAPRKLKKADGPPQLDFEPTVDILASLATAPQRPRLLVGFAAETEDALEAGSVKRRAKKCDWIVANDVSEGVMGGDINQVHLIRGDKTESWPSMTKTEVADRLALEIATALRSQN